MDNSPPAGLLKVQEWPRTRRHAAIPPTTRRLVVVSNRVAAAEKAKNDTGGLAVGVLAALHEQGGIWFGWSGNIATSPDDHPEITEHGRITYATIDLGRTDYNEYYAGYANRVLWPLLHYRSSLVDFKREDLAGYLRVNAQFARSLLPLTLPHDLIWVHDYHLIPLAAELRRGGARQPIGFFLHTPFPAPEILRVLPNHRQLVEQMCAYDLLGFQTQADVDAFSDYVLREAGGVRLAADRLGAFGRQIVIGCFPIGIDVDLCAEQAETARTARATQRLADSLVGRQLLVGVDRLDYSKGLIARFAAFSRLLEDYAEMRGRMTYLQIAPPTRSDVPEYSEIRRGLEQAAGQINGRYAEPDWTPLRYLNRSFARKTLLGFFRLSQIGLVTPLRDGMNLVAKEYVAAQNAEDPGVLILSCFAGAARELSSAVLVNPYDRDGVAGAMAHALEMSLGERQERWSEMMRCLRRHDITKWRDSFVRRLTEIGAD